MPFGRSSSIWACQFNLLRRHKVVTDELPEHHLAGPVGYRLADQALEVVGQDRQCAFVDRTQHGMEVEDEDAGRKVG